MSPAERLRLLVVDDSAVAGSRLLNLLGTIPGVELLPQAWNVAGARRAFCQGAPDLVVTDFRLPDGTGLDVLRHVKRVWPWTVVVVMTNEELGPFQQRCFDAGADYCLDKSTDQSKLLRILEERLASPPETREAGFGRA